MKTTFSNNNLTFIKSCFNTDWAHIKNKGWKTNILTIPKEKKFGKQVLERGMGCCTGFIVQFIELSKQTNILYQYQYAPFHVYSSYGSTLSFQKYTFFINTHTVDSSQLPQDKLYITYITVYIYTINFPLSASNNLPPSWTYCTEHVHTKLRWQSSYPNRLRMFWHANYVNGFRKDDIPHGLARRYT